jgi:hypothetical protein
MNSLTQYTELLRRFPAFELSYETVSHKKVSVQYPSIALSVPSGRKYFMWFTYREHSCVDACYMIGLDKDKRICSVEEWSIPGLATGRSRVGNWSIPGLATERSRVGNYGGGNATKYCLGTIVYGTMCEFPEPAESKPVFVAEDIYYFQGNPLKNLCFGDRLGFLRDFATELDIALPIMWFVDAGKELNPIVPPDLAKRAAYLPHHIQYRVIGQVAPYINVAIPKRGNGFKIEAAPVTSSDVAQKISATSILKPLPRFDFSKPAYRYAAVFNVTADPQLDLYHLYAYGGSASTVYCGLAGIQSFKTSVFMNRIFRRIRENENLDLAEESEDEADFENTDVNKFVNLDAVVPLECVFNLKHKKWIPVRLAGAGDKVIHIEKLVVGGSNMARGGGKFQRR